MYCFAGAVFWQFLTPFFDVFVKPPGLTLEITSVFQASLKLVHK